ncbi:MAG: hypothetical protein DRN90_01765 [Thermoproteota archaeon]|nr:MAG: hypothetical protein DRN90_01765 [Candidatus Korarchaeota archaeon]
MQNFREALEILEQKGLLLSIKEPRSVMYEIARELKAEDGKRAILFEKPLLSDGNPSPIRVAGGICSNIRFILEVLGLNTRKELRELLRKAINNPILPVESERAPVKEIGLEEFDLRRDLPILKHYSGEPGPYITTGIVIVEDETGKFSASYHRMTPISRNRLVLRAVEGRKLHRLITKAEREGRELNVAVAIGVGMNILIAGATPAEDRDKLGIAGAISGSPVELTDCETVEAKMPGNAEIVLEGKILPRIRELEGPFYEILGKDVVRKQPVLEVSKIWRRKDAIYQALLPGGKEHEILMGLPVEALLEESVSKVAEVKNLCMTPAGGMWVEVAISIKKERDEQPMLVALNAIVAHKSLKRIIIVDEDVDVENYEELMKAVVQRADPSRDYKVIADILGSSLDHSNIRFLTVKGEKVPIEYPRSKIIIDATIKGPKELFERPEIPPSGRKSEE